MEAETKRRSINEISTDARILINVLEKRMIKEGDEFVSYEDLSKAIGRDVRNGARGILQTARRHIQGDHGVIIRSVRGEGIKKTSDYAGVMDSTSKGISRKAKRTMKEVVNAVAGKELSNEQQIGVNARLSQLGAIMLFSKPKATKKLESAVTQNANNELPTAETLKLFEK